MIFDALPLAEAEGAILAHSLALPGRRLKKGRVLSADDIAALTDAGRETVIAAKLTPDDMPEDEAARQIAEAARGDGVETQAAFTGRANLYATRRGVAVIDRERIDALNLIDETITIATVAPYDLVEPGQMLATVKIIPFAAPRASVEKASAIAAGNAPLLRVASLAAKTAGLIMTRLPGTKDSVLDKTRTVLSQRLADLDSTIGNEIRCAHTHQAVAEAVARQRAAGLDLVLIFGASAITDRRDEVPAGIAAAGGTIEHFGMPVDPGNLLLLARHGDTPVIGLPGCARSPKLNGFDWVLRRLVADLPVRREDIMRMGAGGLLKEIPSRPQPRHAELGEPFAPRAPRIAALVLAAGQSRRMGRANKLLAPVDGKPLLAHALDAALQSQCVAVTVVSGHEAEQVGAAIGDRAVQQVHNPDFAAGLSTSLNVGLAALPGDIDGAVVILADMPRIRPDHINRLIAAFNPVEGRAICVPTLNGKRGNPVLFAADLFDEMRAVSGDVGARHLIGAHDEQVAEVPVDDEAVLLDIDTPAALAALVGHDPRAAE